MGLNRPRESNTVFLQVRDNSLWQEIKQAVDGCDAIEVKNPTTGEVKTKYGYKFHSVEGRATGLVKYDKTDNKVRYFGFKLHIKDGGETFILDMPYSSQILRRFLRVAPNFDWNLPISIAIFKGKKKDGTPELGVWFQQRGETVKAYFTKDNPHGMPEAIYYQEVQQWDFRAQHLFLIEQLKSHTIPQIEEAAKRVEPPVAPAQTHASEPDPDSASEPPPLDWHPTDDDVPF